MKFHPDIKVFGNKSFRDKKCPKEIAEQITFVNTVRRDMPDIGAVMFHVKNEGKRTRGAAKEKIEGMLTGASDIVIPGNPSLCIEIKRADHTICSTTPDQVNFLLAAQKLGSFACYALGYKGALLAVEAWLNEAK